MRFPYLKLGPRDFVPVVPIRVLGVNTGAGVSICHADHAETLGIDLMMRKGVASYRERRGLVEIFIHKLKVTFAGEQHIAKVGFAKQLGVGFNLLGQGRFFDRSRICLSMTSAAVLVYTMINSRVRGNDTDKEKHASTYRNKWLRQNRSALLSTGIR